MRLHIQPLTFFVTLCAALDGFLFVERPSVALLTCKSLLARTGPVNSSGIPKLDEFYWINVELQKVTSVFFLVENFEKDHSKYVQYFRAGECLSQSMFY